jgi:hypothetical protein
MTNFRTQIFSKNKKRVSKTEIHRRNTGYAVDILLQWISLAGSQPILM